ncbi:MAG TPA: VWA domain-containing protein [Longimicrobiaceae bacterium]|nr:VWA domain-containing protein [Longimicrobiaceae bacterium]
MTLQWMHPLWLAGIPVVLLLAVLAARRSPAVPLPRAERLTERAVGWLGRAPGLLRLLALVLLLVALARPRTPGAVVEEHTNGVPIVVAIDVSSSMLAEDFPPQNRLAAAKRTVGDFVAQRPDDPIGLVALAGEALTVVPVTTYHPVLLAALRDLRVGLLEDGTAIGDGLAIAVNRLREVPAHDRVVILMSDGENNRGSIEPLQAAQAAAAFGIQVYTIGVGSRGVARVPVERGPNGLRYAQLPVGLDEQLLRSIARTTGGRYFRATDPATLRQIYAEIGRLVKSPVETRRRVLYTEWYLPVLALAAAALVLEWLLRGSRWGVVPG